ncbi:hypothetical protein Dde_3394 [Oleidesulfovibrio alaskensis G20]|uniref:Uncharacterized protein n=1 Tax=Oleidesulfovibrio alaskensis (strain ATCC BAA-1058 / DSM 17464 / G20) TaxID=207559 RepID=Q30VV8_OLEA2|nr:hypothetical protein [Oleidesulfovibrio alaskensis]ABB40188.1 hypothetical protein Dde_3394 [Oleidesulfovibrio alaskensis G20]
MKYSPSTNAFYHPAVHGHAIPADAVAVSPEEHATLLAAQARGQIIRPDENGCPVAVTPAAPPAPTRAELYTAKQTEIRDGAESMLTALAAEYAPLERQTWNQQAAEAEALQADADAPAPLVRAIAATRGMPVGELAARILANRTAWVAVSGHVVGQRLAYQDALEATQGLDDAQAADTIQGINPVYILPEVNNT